MKNFAVVADKVSDSIVALVNATIETHIDSPDAKTAKYNVLPLQILAGQLLALKSFLATMPESRPDVLVALTDQVDVTIQEILAISKKL